MIDQLLALDPGRRGIERFFVRGGAAAAALALRRSRRALLTTGFAVGPGLPETDGPPGAAVLGRALRRLGDAVTVPPLQAALTALGEPVEVVTFHPMSDAAGAARRILAEYAPGHLVSVERPGRASDGDYRSARSDSVKEWNGPLDELFLQAPKRAVTVGIGDGGNEIGMGNVRPRIARGGSRARAIASIVRVKHLVVAGTSNWGAYAVVAELSRLTARALLHSAEEERAMVRACVAAGAVDGITRRHEATVDGLPLEAHVGMLELLRLFAQPRKTGGRDR